MCFVLFAFLLLCGRQSKTEQVSKNKENNNNKGSEHQISHGFYARIFFLSRPNGGNSTTTTTTTKKRNDRLKCGNYCQDMKPFPTSETIIPYSRELTNRKKREKKKRKHKHHKSDEYTKKGRKKEIKKKKRRIRG
ncbi:hypothetical protein, unlikely [Trypanosoma brucei gambiense DAL972]|uniref:T. brucei spp.-specific protein n=1 Tax=Trypanosoma brucei gambiense (strain MHOM/CI/86/DAL972) TaxID=679716 RepID=C9ZMW6_TRYB9|nr:hypothetical protein, unlikely [Trypanosoma brucei gambiense DAL972]CBH10619.1 hypothetical protein, unlikely [Trypanosoma brucei gambiense DAL972]|eukprot:XP_011772908.1 hypothetical protein, unlikely [Trypanosoma brucei gambiense DAL972]